ncbi:insecticidal delta-endotoxin Cry8Ea1 family protein [Bacillus cereus group sp. IBL03679]|uniref:insecticidal delta-endotoxin Cry8Ea1 family protein n=1 Tax=Bacillus cereus group sp. IBL03679 TaxID=3240095 RepID=UPI003D2F62B4
MNQNSNNNGMDSQPKHPFTNAPGSEVQQMNYKDWMHMDTAGAPMALSINDQARDGVIIATGIGWAILGFVPVVGPGLSAAAGVLNVIVPFLWPENGNSQITWEKLMSTVEERIDQRVDTLIKSRAIETTRVLQSRMRDYLQAISNLKTDPNNETYKADVRREFDRAEDDAKAAIIQFNPHNANGTEDTKHNILLLANYAQAANLHLLLLRDVVQYGAQWGFSPLEVQQYYSNTSSVGNPGMLQLLAQYTDHCVNWYNTGLQQQYDHWNWDKFNDFRRDMTIMVLDIVSFWPTYDPNLYAVPTKSQLTRTVYTQCVGKEKRYGFIEPTLAAPRLFSWLNQVKFHVQSSNYETSIAGLQQTFKNTLSGTSWQEGLKGLVFGNEQNLNFPSPTTGDEVWWVITHLKYNRFSGRVEDMNGFQFEFTQSPVRDIAYLSDNPDYKKISGLPCTGGNVACTDKNLYSHRFSYLGSYGAYDGSNSPHPHQNAFTHGWTHISADHNNLIDAQKITQIPAVKASSISGGARVVKGPGSTGGDLVELPFSTAGRITLNVTLADITKSYQVRLRYAFGSASTSAADTLRYTDFPYSDPDIVTTDSTEYTYTYTLNPSDFGGLEGKFFIDKIEFIPIEESPAVYTAKQDLV